MSQFAGRNLQTASVTVNRAAGEKLKFSIFDKIENRDMSIILNSPLSTFDCVNIMQGTKLSTWSFD